MTSEPSAIDLDLVHTAVGLWGLAPNHMEIRSNLVKPNQRRPPLHCESILLPLHTLKPARDACGESSFCPIFLPKMTRSLHFVVCEL